MIKKEWLWMDKFLADNHRYNKIKSKIEPNSSILGCFIGGVGMLAILIYLIIINN
jgi:hypothetical protein